MNDIPYPGLRPFTREESHLFFGRDEHTDQLLDKLAETRFIAVTGLSGCGKSSLVRAGLLANLEFGYMADAGPDWGILAMRPGMHPLKNLAKVLVDAHLNIEHEGAQPEQRQDIESISQRLSSGGHLELARILHHNLPSTHSRNFLLLVDQFEELFRYENQGSLDERKFFVELLLTSAEQRDVQIYVVITIRSDWLGQCAVFQGLPEVINAGQFLAPRLTREQLRLAIIAPAQVAEGAIEDRLILQLLKDIENNSDQLPVLQHCLMRMWHKAKERIGDNEEISLSLEDYENVGGIQHALSNHADEAFNELTPKQQKIAETLFRRITERSPDLRDKRHPVPVCEIAVVAEVSTSDVTAVAEKFRRADRCFLTPSPADCGTLQDDTDLDISHESLIRQWNRLNKWTDQEVESAETYQRLEQTVRLWKEGKAALWSTPDLENALEWRDRERPTHEWASRYGENFQLAMQFLDASEQAQEEERLQEEQKRRRELMRKIIYAGSVVALVVAIISIVFASWAFWERSNANKAKVEAEGALVEVEKAKAIAEAEKIRAQKALQETEKASKQAEEQRKVALEAEKKAKEAKEEAVLNSSRFQEMVNATFGFLSESGQNKKFFDWVEEALTIEQLMPALELMIKLSESMKEEEKAYWLQELSTMPDELKVELLYILGKAAAEKTRGK
ncbi:MAG: hypothetical protein GY797_18735 [Deltaproteobacteria bacterium]|nr:hypothetical protein [Deltaproteobacteria bacterium]